ncbi:MAG: hypothetical protein NZ694_07430 [Tepidimonas sp.]|nr:hypothetical protein [Tepidimonas sp.]
MSIDAPYLYLRLALPALLGLSVACAAHAQSAPTAAAATAAPEPKVERLVHQDGYSRIEELRIGGRTRSIEVQTRSGLAGYEVRPLDPGQDDQRSGAGQRRWRVLAF